MCYKITSSKTLKEVHEVSCTLPGEHVHKKVNILALQHCPFYFWGYTHSSKLYVVRGKLLYEKFWSDFIWINFPIEDKVSKCSYLIKVAIN